MRRFISVVFFLALLALVVYNVRQVSQLRREVADLKSQVAGLKADKNDEPSGALSLITKARQYADQAQESVRNGNLKRAKAELEKSLRFMQQAYRTGGSESSETMGKAQRKINDTRAMVEHLMRKLEKEPQKSNGG